jgi:glycine cleavage system aminomethyltransferase T
MLRDVHDEGRPFVGRTAIRRELDEGTSRWRTVGIVVDWQHWDRLHRDAGLLPAKDEHPLPYQSMLYDASHGDAGYATSVMYSPVLQRHVGLARVRPALAEAGTELHLELTVNHHPTTVRVRTARLPLFDPARKTAMA